MLDITSILSDAIETCGFDAEEYAENRIIDACSDILRDHNIKTMLKMAIDGHVERHITDIEDMLDDAVDDYAKEVVDNAF